MRVKHDRRSGFGARLFDRSRQRCFGLILNRLIDCQNNRLAGATRNFGALVGATA